MSWSFSAVGKSHAVIRAINESHNNSLTGQSGSEWQEAKPALLALAAANCNNVVEINANGHASFTGASMEESVKTGYCSVTIRPIVGFVSYEGPSNG